MARNARISNAFSPGAPLDKFDLFAGRTLLVQDIINAISIRGQHVIIFGERGVGKTSLSRVLSEFLDLAGLQRLESGSINCDGSDDFDKLWKKIFRQLKFATTRKGIGFRGTDKVDQRTFNDLWANNAVTSEVTPDDVRFILEHLPKTTIIIDEIDRIKDARTIELMADTVKTLSDHSVDTTLILVGVADSVNQLIEEHYSIERALTQVHMPRMSPRELYEILDKALHSVNMTIDMDAKNRIAWLSRGLPHFTHLLGMHAAHGASNNDRTQVTIADVEGAIGPTVEKAQQSIRTAHHKATSSPRRDNLYTQVLLACALASTDDLGYFSAADVKGPMTRIMGKAYEINAFSQHLNDFCSPNRGPILQKTGTSRKFRFRFINPMMQPFVVINGLSKGLIPASILEEHVLGHLSQ